MVEHSSEEFKSELSKLSWQPLVDFYDKNPNKIDWKQSPPYLLFRVSDVINNDKGIFASLFLMDGHCAFTDIRLSKNIKNFPFRHARIARVYKGDKSNLFYGDGGIEYTKKTGKMVNSRGNPYGKQAENIAVFTDDHYETELNSKNELYKDFVYLLLTTNEELKDNPWLDTDKTLEDLGYKIAKVKTDSKLWKMLSDNEVKPKVNNLIFSRKEGRD